MINRNKELDPKLMEIVRKADQSLVSIKDSDIVFDVQKGSKK